MVPNIIHFIFGLQPDFGGKPFGLVHYLAVKSAVEVNKPDKVYMHYMYEPRGKYWELVKPLVLMRQIDFPNRSNGKLLTNHAHKTDVLRLQVLKQYGGIYLDLDTICKKPFDLNVKNCAIAEEGNQGLCNAVILAEPQSMFIRIWLSHAKTFDFKDWGGFAVQLPLSLYREFPELVTPLPEKTFLYPGYKDLDSLFVKTLDFPDVYVHHLWETMSWEEHLKMLTEPYIKNVDTTYNVIARKYL